VSVLETTKLTSALGAVELGRGGSGGPAPVVYLHSASGEGTSFAFVEILADTREVVVPLLPGFGASEGIDEVWDVEDLAFHVLDLLDRLGFAQADLVGLSLGGWVAAEVAVRWPERVRRMVLVDAVGLYVEGAPIKEIFGRPLRELAADLYYDRSHPMAQLMRQLDSLQGDPGAIPFDLIRPVLQAQAATAKVGWNPYLHDPKLRGRLRRITSPTLVVHARQDGILPREHALAYVQGIAGAKLAEVDRAAHLAPLERPEETARLVIEHLDG
jgi:pimeloyl-ACP methyl ester carboxylesterase